MKGIKFLENFLGKWMGVFRKCPPIKPKKAPSPSLRDLYMRMILVCATIRVCGLGELGAGHSMNLNGAYKIFHWRFGLFKLFSRCGAMMRPR